MRRHTGGRDPDKHFMVEVELGRWWAGAVVHLHWAPSCAPLVATPAPGSPDATCGADGRCSFTLGESSAGSVALKIDASCAGAASMAPLITCETVAPPPSPPDELPPHNRQAKKRRPPPPLPPPSPPLEGEGIEGHGEHSVTLEYLDSEASPPPAPPEPAAPRDDALAWVEATVPEAWRVRLALAALTIVAVVVAVECRARRASSGRHHALAKEEPEQEAGREEEAEVLSEEEEEEEPFRPPRRASPPARPRGRSTKFRPLRT